MNMRISFVALLGFLWLQGCAVIPVMQDEPFKDKTVTNLEPGEADKADVLMALGEPGQVYDRDKLFIYSDDQIHAVWFMVLGGGYSAGIVGGAIGTRHFLVFEFDEKGRVTDRAVMPYGTQYAAGMLNFSKGVGGALVHAEGPACVPSGVCIGDERATRVFAREAQEREVKQFVPNDRCTVYLYRDDTVDLPRFGGIVFDHHFVGRLDSEDFFRIETNPGHHAVVVKYDTFSQLTVDFKQLKFRCRAGDVLFVRARLPQYSIWGGKSKNPYGLKLVAPSEGRAVIAGKRLRFIRETQGPRSLWQSFHPQI